MFLKLLFLFFENQLFCKWIHIIGNRQRTVASTGLCGIYLKKMNPNLKKLKMACAPLVAVAGGGK